MVVPSMSYEEIALEFLRDYKEEMYPKALNVFGKRQAMGSFISKHIGPKQHYVFEPIECESRRHNKWLCFFWTDGKRQYKQTGILRSCYMLYSRSDGFHAVTCDPYHPELITFYTPHYFERYRERCLKDNTVSYHNVIRDYSTNCTASLAQPIASEKYNNSIFAVSQAGVSLGENINDNIWEYRTYISFEMLKGNQEDIVDEYLPMIDIVRDKLPQVQLSYAGVIDTTVRKTGISFRMRVTGNKHGVSQPAIKVKVNLSAFEYNTIVQFFIDSNGDLSYFTLSHPDLYEEIYQRVIREISYCELEDIVINFESVIDYARSLEDKTGSPFIE